CLASKQSLDSGSLSKTKNTLENYITQKKKNSVRKFLALDSHSPVKQPRSQVVIRLPVEPYEDWENLLRPCDTFELERVDKEPARLWVNVVRANASVTRSA